MLNWWLDFGVDGFRLDVITRLKKMPGFPDTKAKPDPLLDRNGFVMDKSMCADIEGIHEWIQELNREVNTISSKSQDVPITKLVVSAKAEIEKIREQVQNIE